MKTLKSILFCLVAFLGFNSVVIATPFSQPTGPILYVKPIPTGSANCTSWDNACGLQAALDIAAPGNEIWVAAGTYLPTKLSSSTYERSATFQLESGVAIYGGFPTDGGEWEERDPVANLTTLSGDIGLPIISSDNSYNVVTANGVDGTALLDGFTIRDGNASFPFNNGGGMYNQNSSPTLSNLTFANNHAGSSGGGMYNTSSNPTLTTFTFTGNSAQYGGGMSNRENSSPTLTHGIFIGNSTDSVGGGMANYSSSPTLTNVTFASNPAESGGGMSNSGSHPSLTNVTFNGNSARTRGGAIYNFNASNPTLVNVTISENSAVTNGGGILNAHGSSPTLTNAIVWKNLPALNQIKNEIGSTVMITFSDIESAVVYEGTGNINLDPLLGILADNGGFIQTQALGAGSPVIDAGNPETCPDADQRGYHRPINGAGDASEICDMGAYEYGSSAAGFTLAVQTEGSGHLAIDPAQTAYYFGELVTLTATAAPGWSFTGWGGDATGTDNPLIVTIEGDMAITSNFQKALFKYLLFPIFK